MQISPTKDQVGSLLILAFALFYLRYCFDIALDTVAVDDYFTPRSFPISLAIAAITVSLLQLVLPAASTQQSEFSPSERKFHWRPVVLLILAMLMYALSIDFLGFILSSFLFLQTGFFILGERRLGFGIALSAGLVVFLWLLLTQVFDLYLDSGDLYRVFFGEG